MQETAPSCLHEGSWLHKVNGSQVLGGPSSSLYICVCITVYLNICLLKITCQCYRQMKLSKAAVETLSKSSKWKVKAVFPCRCRCHLLLLLCYHCSATKYTNEGMQGNLELRVRNYLRTKGVSLFPESTSITGGITGGIMSLFVQSRNFLHFLSLQLLPFLPSTPLTRCFCPSWGMWSTMGPFLSSA